MEVFCRIVAFACTVRQLYFLLWFSFSGCVALAATEQWWHRRLRRFRSQARLVLLFEILEELVATEGKQGTYTTSSRFSAAKEVSIADVSKDCQPSDLGDVDMQILSGEAHLRPSPLRIMQSTLEASRCSIWPSISKSTFQTPAEREWRKEESRAEFQPRGDQGRQGRSSRRCDLQQQAALGGEFAPMDVLR